MPKKNFNQDTTIKISNKVKQDLDCIKEEYETNGTVSWSFVIGELVKDHYILNKKDQQIINSFPNELGET